MDSPLDDLRDKELIFTQTLCPGCSVSFSAHNDDKLPKFLPCRHTICSSCANSRENCPECSRSIGSKDSLSTSVCQQLVLESLPDCGIDTVEEIQTVRARTGQLCQPEQLGLDIKELVSILEQHKNHSAGCTNSDAVFFLGPTGAGKTLTINYTAQRQIINSQSPIETDDGFQVLTRDYEDLLVVIDPLDGFTVGHTADSQTRLLNCYRDEDLGLVLVDTPGFDDTAGTTCDIANSIAITSALRDCKSVRLVLVINSKSIMVDRGIGLSKLMSLCKRFINNLNTHATSILPLFTHSKGMTAQKLYSALKKAQGTEHFLPHDDMLQHLITVLKRESEHILLRPGDTEDTDSADRLQQLRLLVKELPPISDPCSVLNSPLSDLSRSDLEIACQAIVDRTVRALKTGTSFPELQGDVTDLAMLSNSLHVASISARLSDAVLELQASVVNSCQHAKEAMVQRRFSDLKCSLDAIIGFEWLEDHIPNLKRDHWTPVIEYINSEVRSASLALQEVDAMPMTLPDLRAHLDLLKGAACLKDFLDSEHHTVYEDGKATVFAWFKQLSSKAERFVEQQDFSSIELADSLQRLSVMASLPSHFEDTNGFMRRIYEKVEAAFAQLEVKVNEKLGAKTFDSQFADDMHRLEEVATGMLLPGEDREDARERYAVCVRRFGEECNNSFEMIDTALRNQDFQEVGNSLHELQMATDSGIDKNLQQRLASKLADTQARVEENITCLHGLLDACLVRKEDRDLFVHRLCMLSQAADGLRMSIPAFCQRLDQECADLHNRVEHLQNELLESGIACLEVSDATPAAMLEQFGPLVDVIVRMEWMCIAVFTLSPSMEACNLKLIECILFFCDEQMETAKALVIAPEGHCASKLQLSLDRLMVLESVFQRAVDSGEQFNHIFKLYSNLSRGSEDVFGNTSKMCLSSTGTVSSCKDLVMALRTSVQAVSGQLAQWADKARSLFQSHLDANAFSEAHCLLGSVVEFQAFEKQTNVSFTALRDEMVSCARAYVATSQSCFLDAVKRNDMEAAHGQLQNLTEMLIMKRDVETVQEAVEQLNTRFHQKTSRLVSDVTSLLVAGSIDPMATLLRTNKSLGETNPAVASEYAEAEAMLVQHFEKRFETGFVIARRICPERAMPEENLIDLAALLKELSSSQGLFDLLDRGDWLRQRHCTVQELVRRQVEGVARHGSSYVREMKISCFLLVYEMLGSLKIIPLVANEVDQHLDQLRSDLAKRFEALPADVSKAIENGDSRLLARLSARLQAGIDTEAHPELDMTLQFDKFQQLIETSIEELSKNIDVSLEAYDVKTACVKMRLFKKLLVCEDIRSSWAEQLRDFEDRMEWIKEEMVGLRMATSSPDRMRICLEGFKEVNPLFFQRTCGRILDGLNNQVLELTEQLQRHEVWVLKVFRTRIKHIEGFQIALRGLEYEVELQKCRSQLMSALEEAIHTVLDDVEHFRVTSCWVEVEGRKSFLDQAMQLFTAFRPDRDSSGDELMKRYTALNKEIKHLEEYIAENRDLVSAFSVWNPESYDATALNAFLKQLQGAQGFINGRLGTNVATASQSDSIATLKAGLEVGTEPLSNLWERQQFDKIGRVVLGLRTLRCIEVLRAEVNNACSDIVRAISSKMDAGAQSCISMFTDAVEDRTVCLSEKLPRVNEALESLKKACRELVHPCDLQQCGWVKQVVDVMLRWTDEKLGRLQIASGTAPQPQAVADALVGAWEVPSGISEATVKEHARRKIHIIFESMSNAVNFSELAAVLTDSGDIGKELVDTFSRVFSEYHDRKFKEVSSGMTFKDALKKLALLNSIPEEQVQTLKNLHMRYSTDFESFLRAGSAQRVAQMVLTQHEHFPPEKVLAGVLAVWSLSRASETRPRGADTFPRPHPMQLLCMFLLLSLEQPGPVSGSDGFFAFCRRALFSSNQSDGQNKHHLVELKTGEGKSLVLGTLAVLLALAGCHVDCVCYSRLLSGRDHEAFLPIFEQFQVESLITYGTWQQLCERKINEHGDVRKRLKNFFSDESITPVRAATSAVSSKMRVALVDEVDVFFSADFYGATYNPITVVQHESITQLQHKIWENRHLSEEDLTTMLQEGTMYKEACNAFPRFGDLIERAVADMVSDVRAVDSHKYIVHDNTIGYPGTDGSVSTTTICGYKTLFTCFKEVEAGTFRWEQQQAHHRCGLRLFCGRFSYAEIPDGYGRILGVTGTLHALGEFERSVLETEYNITKQTLIPSIFGESQLVFREVADLSVEDDEVLYNTKIRDEIVKANEDGHPVLVFFEDDESMKAWCEAGYSEGFRQLARITRETENLEHYIGQAMRKGAVSLLCREFGRGLDFASPSNNLHVHVVQTFLSEERSEEIQIKGRTARQGSKGFFKLILSAEKLTKFGVTKSELTTARERGTLYKLLDGKRNKLNARASDKRRKTVMNARAQHEESMRFQSLLLAGEDASADSELPSLLCKLNQ